MTHTDFSLDTVLLNEIAPRPHNSGHYTIEACPSMSQYKSQLLAILGLMPSFPDNTIPMAVPAAIMLNILGGPTPEAYKEITSRALTIPNAALYMYGKESKPARKIGHINVLANSMSEAEAAVAPLVKLNDEQRAARLNPSSTQTSNVSAPSSTSGQPLVLVTMGSDSDLPKLTAGIEILKKFGIPYFVTITSAHRTPDRMTAFAREAAAKGYKAIIAAAGGAAHLPGMIAASTSLPVIGVPIKGSTLDGMDSLLSIVQMPVSPLLNISIQRGNC
jgi:phosphoribosylaminoimidazole carboxylase